MRLSHVYLLASGVSFIVSCSNSNSNGAVVVPSNSPAANALVTVNNTGVIPVIGNLATTTTVHVHNNSSATISEMKYSATINTQSGTFIDANSAALCSTISPNQSCHLLLLRLLLKLRQLKPQL